MTRALAALLFLCSPPLAAHAQPPPETPLVLTFLDVGQGDAVLIQAPSGQTVLVDGGRDRERALEQLLALGVTRLELVVATHADFDHIHGLIEVVRHYRPAFFMDNAMPHTTQTYAELLAAVQAAGSQLLEPSARTISLGEASLRVLPPPGEAAFGQNDNSVGLLLEYGDFKASLTGDSEALEWNYWQLLDLLVPVNVHKASHHGSENGDVPLSMSRLQPEVVIISVGEGNSYGHPSASALALYEAAGASVYRTDLQGSVRVEVFRDGAYRLSAERPSAPAAPAPSPAPPGRGKVVVRCVLYDPSGEDAGQEAVTLFANETTDLSGWRLEDEAGSSFVLSGELPAGREHEVANPGSAVWNNGGDTALLFDGGGRLVDAFSYAGGGARACR